MNSRLFQLCCVLSLLTAPLWTLTACDREVAHTESSKTDSDGTKTEKQTTVTKDANGNVTVDKTKTESNP